MFLIRPLRRVRKNHGLSTSRAVYQGKSGLCFSLIGELIQGADFSLCDTIIFGCAFRLFISECSIQQCVKIYTELTSLFQCHRVNSVQNLALRHISLKIHINRLHYSTFDSRNAYGYISYRCFTLKRILLSFNLIFTTLYITHL